ncbi:MAG TPA: hypothetical protein VMY39_01540 [Planctomycetota bacterium]|nr:hypothetical protein [Planctomycetota bacterium]
MFHRAGWAVLALMVLSGPVCGLTLDPLPGWVTAGYLDKAIEFAKKKDVPVVLLYAPQEGGGEVSRARVYMRLEGLGGWARVLVYESARPPAAFQKVAGQVEAPGEGLPVMYFATPELRILGFVQSGAHKKTSYRVIVHVKETMTWLKKSREDIESAENGAKIGKFGTLLSTYQRINNEDKRAGVATTATWNIVIGVDEVDTFYFPELPGKMGEVEAHAESYLQKARTEFGLKNYEAARKMVYPMAKDKGEVTALKAAAELLEQIDAAMKAKP